MIYIKRLIQRKKIKPLSGILFVLLLGIFCIFSALFDLILRNQSYYTGTYLYALADTARIFTYFAAGRILLGCYIIYLALWNLPKWTADSQNKEDYHVSITESHIDVQFQNWHWHLKREDISASSFYFFDQTHRFVPPSSGFQVYHALKIFFPDTIGKSLPDMNSKSKLGSICQFAHTRKATPDEKKIFLKQTEKNSSHLIGKLFSLLLICGSLSLFSYSKKDMGFLLLLLYLFIFLLIYFGIRLFLLFDSDRQTGLWIQNHDLYVATGYPYAKHTSHTDEGSHYTIKVWDGTQVYLSEWFFVDRKTYDQPETIPVSLYYYKDKNNTYQTEIIMKKNSFC